MLAHRTKKKDTHYTSGIASLRKLYSFSSVKAFSTTRENDSSAIEKYLGKDTIKAPDGFNRWMALPPIFAVQASIASVYSWSIFTSPLTRELGIFAQSSNDWNMEIILPIFSVGAVAFGFTSFFAGNWIEKWVPELWQPL